MPKKDELKAPSAGIRKLNMEQRNVLFNERDFWGLVLCHALINPFGTGAQDVAARAVAVADAVLEARRERFPGL